ncbi:hypothetical protein HQ560_15995 [bacterium]|nr:hypothetical protein [bacterium]
MSAEDARRQACERKAEDELKEAERAGCCGPAAADTAEGCPCAAAFQSHRVVCTIVLAAAALAFLVSQVGGVMGIIAFFRTL